MREEQEKQARLEEEKDEQKAREKQDLSACSHLKVAQPTP